MTVMLERTSFANADDEDVADTRFVAYSEEFSSPQIVQTSFDHHLDGAALITGESPTLAEVIDIYYDAKDELDKDPTAPLDLVVRLVDEAADPTDDEQEQARDAMVLEALKDATRYPDIVTAKTLINGIKAIDRVSPRHKRTAVRIVEKILRDFEMSGPGANSDPQLLEAARITFETLPSDVEYVENISDQVEIIADIKTANALNKTIRRKKRLELFRKVVTGRIFIKKNRTPSERELDAKMIRIENQMFEKEALTNRIKDEDTSTFPALSLEDLESDDDENTAMVDDFIARQLGHQ